MTDQKPSDLYADMGLATFYDTAQPQRDDFACCRKLAEQASSVLDLGCGTGDLAISLAGDRRVVAVDPAKAMLDLAEQKHGADGVVWIKGDARSIRLGETFDLIMLTGHAFQVFLDRSQRLECLRTIAAHLSPDGVFVFDSRNPDFDAPKERTKAQTLTRLRHPQLGEIEKWNVSNYDRSRQILTYSNHYRIVASGEVRSAEDRIAYPPQAELADLIVIAGLHAVRWLGDWTGAPFGPEAREIIPVGRLAR